MAACPPLFQRILVATDFSEHADTALVRGVWLGGHSQGEVVVAHVLTNLRQAFTALPYASQSELLRGDIETFERDLRAASQQHLAQAVLPYASGSVSVKTETLLGSPDVALTHAVQNEGYEVVVMGSRGLSSIKRLFLGSTAQRMIRQCPSSVWVVKAAHGWPLKRLLVGVDFSEVSRRALDQAAWLAAKSNAVVDVLHVVELDEALSGFKSSQRTTVRDSEVGTHVRREALQHLNDWCTRTGLPSSQLAAHVEWGAASTVIADRSQQWKSDLIVLGTVGRTGIAGVLVGNTAERVLQTCDCSVLAVKPSGFISPIQPPAWELHPADEPSPVEPVA